MKNLPVFFVACRVFEPLLARHIPPELKNRVAFLDYGLHANPKKLRKTLQTVLDEIKTPSLIALGYGLCGNGLKDIEAGIHTLLLPKTEDCIAIFLGSDEAYRKEFDEHPGTYYLTGGWLEAGSDPLKEYEKYVEKYGEKTADFVMNEQYKNYKRLALVGHSEEDLAAYRERALRVAEYCRRWNMTYCEISGSDSYVKKLVQAALQPEQAGGEFLLILPGEKIAAPY